MRIHKTRLLHLNSLKSPHRLPDQRRSSRRTGDTRSPWLPEHVISKVAQKCILILTIKESRGKLYIPWNVTYVALSGKSSLSRGSLVAHSEHWGEICTLMIRGSVGAESERSRGGVGVIRSAIAYIGVESWHILV